MVYTALHTMFEIIIDTIIYEKMENPLIAKLPSSNFKASDDPVMIVQC